MLFTAVCSVYSDSVAVVLIPVLVDQAVTYILNQPDGKATHLFIPVTNH